MPGMLPEKGGGGTPQMGRVCCRFTHGRAGARFVTRQGTSREV